MELGSVKQKGGKIIHAWACEGDFTGPPRSNSFEIEWPPRSGKKKEFPEIDKAEWFSLNAASKKINPAQVEFLELLASKV
jgi:predicted NUDIX family NTP pyrophosphohydrolase